MPAILEITDRGFFCPPGDFYIDPWKPVDRAIITHAHADHARWGHRHYLTTTEGLGVLKHRMQANAQISTAAYDEHLNYNGVDISLHPAGHVLGSAQVRIEYRGQIAVITGDYKTEPDRTCTPFEPVPCHLLVSESTFALPIYHWQPQSEIFDQINYWWKINQSHGLASILMAYSLGKAQRLLAGIDPAIGPIYCHGAVEPLNAVYREYGIRLPATQYVSETARDAKSKKTDPQWSQALVIAPPSALGSPWMRRFSPFSTAFASGWMTIRGTRRRQSLDKGFVLSDHADWNGLVSSIKATGAEQVWLTHGYSATLARYLCEIGIEAKSVDTHFTGESGSADPEQVRETPEPQESAGEP